MCFLAREFVVYVNGSRCCAKVDRFWVCKRDNVQVAADAVLYTVLCRQVSFYCHQCIAAAAFLVAGSCLMDVTLYYFCYCYLSVFFNSYQFFNSNYNNSTISYLKHVIDGVSHKTFQKCITIM